MKQIPLTRGMVALVDDEDFDRVAQFAWCAMRGKNTFYAVRAQWTGERYVFHLLHRDILGITAPSIQVDHRDGNGLDNQRANLRSASPAQNRANSRKKAGTSSQYKGVCFRRRLQKWQANITINYKTLHLGIFRDELDAARAYDVAAIQHFGEFARINGA